MKRSTMLKLAPLLLIGALASIGMLFFNAKSPQTTGYLLSISSLKEIHTINLTTNQRESRNILNAWHPYRAEWDILNYTIDEQEGRYLFSFEQHSRYVNGKFIDPPHGLHAIRYDLYTGEKEILELDSFLHEAINNSAYIYALNKNDLLLHHTHNPHKNSSEEYFYEGYIILELFSIEENKVLQSHTIAYTDFPDLFAPSKEKTLSIKYYNPQEKFLLFTQYGKLYRLDLTTMQTSQIDGIETQFTTHHPFGYTRSSSSWTKEYLLVTHHNKYAIYHLASQQIATYLPESLPHGDYYLIDSDKILVHTSRRTLWDKLINQIFHPAFYGTSSTQKYQIYQIQEETATLLWQQQKATYVGWSKFYYPPQLILPSEARKKR
ncbi:hypothetical protein [Entomospira culicis]|uniref:Uncharacterized protein n=1 Tax=Entomospira culicis TaxID=2719989 RepID=A0A968GJL4_9SPIO|nr:hypothetical protein [Entomospira culicis]NIZ19671.1 hypothetical protein [Entomospira culicis]NIZ69885.1 hypothetical protein [Entomospira culicis]WDI36990.1 hypothetical protein PVA46_06645 [Entomospira culicis]WDI38619.1 hypothetical protein PVA47_06655 [Entomospira culicis]